MGPPADDLEQGLQTVPEKADAYEEKDDHHGSDDTSHIVISTLLICSWLFVDIKDLVQPVKRKLTPRLY